MNGQTLTPPKITRHASKHREMSHGKKPKAHYLKPHGLATICVAKPRNYVQVFYSIVK